MICKHCPTQTLIEEAGRLKCPACQRTYGDRAGARARSDTSREAPDTTSVWYAELQAWVEWVTVPGNPESAAMEWLTSFLSDFTRGADALRAVFNDPRGTLIPGYADHRDEALSGLDSCDRGLRVMHYQLSSGRLDQTTLNEALELFLAGCARIDAAVRNRRRLDPPRDGDGGLGRLAPRRPPPRRPAPGEGHAWD